MSDNDLAKAIQPCLKQATRSSIHSLCAIGTLLIGSHVYPNYLYLCLRAQSHQNSEVRGGKGKQGQVYQGTDRQASKRRDRLCGLRGMTRVVGKCGVESITCR